MLNFKRKKITNDLTILLSSGAQIEIQDVLFHKDYPISVLNQIPELYNYFFSDSKMISTTLQYLCLYPQAQTPEQYQFQVATSRNLTKLFSSPNGELHTKIKNNRYFQNYLKTFQSNDKQAISNYSMILMQYIRMEKSTSLITLEMFASWLELSSKGGYAGLVKFYLDSISPNIDSQALKVYQNTLKFVNSEISKGKNPYFVFSILNNILKNGENLLEALVNDSGFFKQLIILIRLLIHHRANSQKYLYAIKFVQYILDNCKDDFHQNPLFVQFVNTHKNNILAFFYDDYHKVQFGPAQIMFFKYFAQYDEIALDYSPYFFVDKSTTSSRPPLNSDYNRPDLPQNSQFQQEWFNYFMKLPLENPESDLQSKKGLAKAIIQRFGYDMIYDVLPSTNVKLKECLEKGEFVERACTNPYTSRYFVFCTGFADHNNFPENFAESQTLMQNKLVPFVRQYKFTFYSSAKYLSEYRKDTSEMYSSIGKEYLDARNNS